MHVADVRPKLESHRVEKEDLCECAWTESKWADACKRHFLPSLRDGASRAVIGDLPSGWSQDEGADLRGLSGIALWSRRVKAGDARPSFFWAKAAKELLVKDCPSQG